VQSTFSSSFLVSPHSVSRIIPLSPFCCSYSLILYFKPQGTNPKRNTRTHRVGNPLRSTHCSYIALYGRIRQCACCDIPNIFTTPLCVLDIAQCAYQRWSPCTPVPRGCKFARNGQGQRDGPGFWCFRPRQRRFPYRCCATPFKASAT
jgi:hypothetical protein